MRLAPRQLLALALGLWVGGAGCLACCRDESAPSSGAGRFTAARPAAHESAAASARSHCPAHKRRAASGHSARRAFASESFRAALLNSAALSGFDLSPLCCREARQAADAARKPRVATVPSSSASLNLAPPDLAPAARLVATDARAFVRDRGGTHARLCVFLI